MNAQRNPVSPIDAAWLRMDSATNAMVITVLFRFAAPLDRDALRCTFERLLEHRKFRQRALRDPRAWTRVVWEDDPEFSLDRHVVHTSLPAPGDESALETLVSSRMSHPLDPSRPLWRVDVIDGPGPGGALLVRVHHAVGDGVSLVRLLLGVSKAGQAQTPVSVGVAPAPRVRSLRALLRRGRERSETLARLLWLPPDSDTMLRGELGSQKVAAFSRPVSLASLKAAAHRRGGHLNDLLTTAVAGALRRYLPSPRPLRALIPIFLQGSGDEVGNHFGMAYLPLPVEEASQEQRLRSVVAAMNAIKAAPDASVAFFILGVMGFASPRLERLGIELFTQKATLLITNVPGPAAAVQLGGQDVESMAVWAPTSGSIGLGFSLLTYNGELRLGVAADRRLVSDPRGLVTLFEEELEGFLESPSEAP